MDKIVSDLQTFVRPIEPHKTTIRLRTIVSDILNKASIPKNIKTNVQITTDQAVSAGRNLLKRVLLNLVTNAVQAMPKGGELTITAENILEDTAVTVKDNGVGIPDKVKPKIFTPLFTTKSKGQGFGLAVCKRVMEAHGGTITFKSKEGKGTEFTIRLPTEK